MVEELLEHFGNIIGTVLEHVWNMFVAFLEHD